MSAMIEHPTIHRMAEPAVRVRVAFLLTALVALAWVSVALLGRPHGPYSQRELPDLAGLPILVPQIEQLIPPQTGSVPDVNVPNLIPGANPSPGGTP